MLLTLPVILGILAVASDSSAANIYARIRAFYQYNKNLPDALGTFFFADSNPPGFYGVTKDVLIKTVEILHETGGWLDGPAVTRKLIFETVASMVADATNCDRAGIVKFCNWCFVAAKGDESIKKYFANPTAKYTAIDKVKDTVSDFVEDKTTAIKETVDYAVTPSSTTTARINPVVKYAIIGVIGYIVIRKLLK